MQVVKEGIDNIQIPDSMLKVKKSSSKKPLHDSVYVVVSSIYPSVTSITIGRMFHSERRDPTQAGLKDVRSNLPSSAFQNVLFARGVTEGVMNSCK